MSDTRALATQLLAWTLVAEIVDERLVSLREAARTAMTETGVERQRVRDDQDDDLGAVTLRAGQWRARVTDEAALLEWVRTNAPHQLMTSVKPGYVAWLKGQAIVNAGDPMLARPVPVDPATGAVVPGVVAERYPGTVAVTKTALARMWARDVITRMVDEAFMVTEGERNARQLPGPAS